METEGPTKTPVPMPDDWAAIHTVLYQLWQATNDPRIPCPPVPLILGGAAFSSAATIRQRWDDLIQWASLHGFADHLAIHLPPAPIYDVAERIAGVSEDGHGWWPEYGEQFHDPKQKPSLEVMSANFESLVKNWQQIVGQELSGSTRPLKFTGRKHRRLLVSANPLASPPWGSWFSVYSNPRAFTAFRSVINRAISPMEVDDVTFITERWLNEAY